MTERYPVVCKEGKRSCLEQQSINAPRFATYHTSIVATEKEGRTPCELNLPRGVAIHEETHQILWQPTTDPIGRVFIVDRNNDRICIHDPYLNYLRNIMHQSM